MRQSVLAQAIEKSAPSLPTEIVAVGQLPSPQGPAAKARAVGHFKCNDHYGLDQRGAQAFMKCSNGHYKHPQLFASTERRKAGRGKGALCMTCQKIAREKAAPPGKVGRKKKAKRGSAWRYGGHDRILLDGTKF
jgi:hypothetical protein